MEQKVWNELRRKMAVEMFVIDSADVMIPADEARKNAAARIEKSDRAKSAAEHCDSAVQQWRNLEHSAGTALIAIEKLEMRVVAA